MAIYSNFLQLATGSARTVNLAQNTLAVLGLQLNGSTSGTLTHSASATTTTYALIWPAAQGSANTYLKNDGSGNLSWAAAGTGTVTSFAFTNGGGFTGSVSNSTTTPTLSLTGTLTGDVTGSLTATVLSATSNATLTTLSALTTASSLSSVGTISSGTWAGTTIAVTHGGTGVTSVTTTPTATSFAGWDANSNLSANNFIEGYATTATAATTTTLTVSSAEQQYFTGSTTQTVKLPVTSTLVTGMSFTIVNLSSGVVTVQSSGSNTLQAMAANTQLVATCISTSGTGTASWNWTYSSAQGTLGANTALSNLTTTSINQNMLPNGSVTLNLGATGFEWKYIYATALFNVTDGVEVISLNNKKLIDTTGNDSVDWNIRSLNDSAGTAQLGWSTSGVTIDTALLMNGSTSGTLTQKAAATTTSYTITWPAAQASGTQVLQNNGSGVLSWASAATGTVTSVSVASANGFAGTVATSTTTPAITISTTVNAPVLAGNGTAISAATTTGTGSTVVLSASPTLTGTLTAAAGSFSSAINMNSNQINNLATPSVSTDAATKGYVDAAISGLTWQGPAKAYAASNVPLTGGATLTIDGYSVQNGDLVLLGNQTTASQNGEYTASGIGTAYTLTANGFPTAAGDAWLILKGTVYADSAFVANAAVPSATFTEFAGPTAYTFSAPLSLSGNTVSITQASGSSNGYLSSTDWNTFNNKQTAGNYITALTGDVTASGPGSAVATIASNAVTYAKFQQVAASSLVGNATGSTANATGITLGATLTFSGSALQTVAMTGDVTTSANSFATTLATVNSNVGTFTNATITVNAKGLVTAASTGSTASTAVTRTLVAGQTFTANTSYAVRWGLTANGETAGRVYAADITTSSFDLFYVIGMASSATTVNAGGNITVTTLGLFTLSSADTAFASNTDGAPVFLTASGTFSTTAPTTSGQAVTRIGVVQVRSATVTSNIIDVDPVPVGVN